MCVCLFVAAVSTSGDGVVSSAWPLPRRRCCYGCWDPERFQEDEQIAAMVEVMKDLEIKLVESLLGVFDAVTSHDDVSMMRTYLDLLARLGHAKQSVGIYTSHVREKFLPSSFVLSQLLLTKSRSECS